jgi:hypothetical protein
MKSKSWILLALFLGAVSLSAWRASVVNPFTRVAASAPPETVMPASLNAPALLSSGGVLIANANNAQGAQGYKWILDGRVVGDTHELRIAHLGIGEHHLRLTYHDVQGRLYSADSTVRVLTTENYPLAMDAVQAAITLPLWDEDELIHLPLIIH